MRRILIWSFLLFTLPAVCQYSQYYRRQNTSQAIDVDLGNGDVIFVSDTGNGMFFKLKRLTGVGPVLLKGQTLRYALTRGWAVATSGSGGGGSYEPVITKSTGFLKWIGNAWNWDNSTYVTGTPWTAMGYVIGTPWTGMGYVTGTPWTGMGYLTSFTELDPVFGASAAHAITSGDISNWNANNSKVTFPGFGTNGSTAAYGNHTHSGVYEPVISKSTGFLTWTGSAWNWDNSIYVTGTPWTAMGYVTGTPWTGMGYLTSFTELDPIFGASAAHGIASGDISSWNGKQAAYSNLTSIGSLANAAGWLHNNGSGTFAYSTPTYTDVGALGLHGTADAAATVTNGRYKTDIISLMLIQADSSMFSDSTFGRILSDGFVIDTISVTVYSKGTASVKLAIYYGSNWTGTGTAVVTAFNTITAQGVQTNIYTFNNATVAKGNFVWAKIKGTVLTCKFFSIQIKGHYI